MFKIENDTSSSSARTRDRLIEAAGSIFAEKGFRAATIRAICGRAGANVASVKYHFSGKRKLYEAVLFHANAWADSHYPWNWDDTAPADARLKKFVGCFLLRILDSGRPAWHGKLMARELVDPTPSYRMVVRALAQPMFGKVEAIARELAGPRAQQYEVNLLVNSVIGQCLFYRQASRLVAELQGVKAYSGEDIELLTRHIVAMSLDGMRRVAGARACADESASSDGPSAVVV